LVRSKTSTKVAVIGGGWAGLAAAIRAVQAGCDVTLFEASRHLGGRARSVEVSLPSGQSVTLDNGQHVLMGAYSKALSLMQTVGVDLGSVFKRQPVRLGLFQTHPWTLRDYLSLLGVVSGWCLRGFSCPQGTTVNAVCRLASPRVFIDVFEPLCLSALNTKPEVACGQVFLRVLKDAFWSASFSYDGGAFKSSDMLIPAVDLGRVFPELAGRWLTANGAAIRLGERVIGLTPQLNQWAVNETLFDKVVVAVAPTDAARLMRQIAPAWSAMVDTLEYRAITTVYAQAPLGFDLKQPLRALPSNAEYPAQFVFQRAEAQGLLAFVVSDSEGDTATIERLVLTQAGVQLGVHLRPVQTITEKRATFACLATMTRPAQFALAGLSVVGDYLDGSYPATIEGAVRSAL
jgi:hydroxysqualene dehydroxylase